MELQWPLILFTFFMCLSSGILFAQSVLALKGEGRAFQNTSLVASFVAMVVGGIAVFLHLQHWERIFNGFGHITSGITQELIGVVLLFLALLVFFLMARRSEDGSVPAWVAWAGIIVPVIMVAVMGHSYLMEGRPSWNTPMLIVYYLINAALMGSLTVLIIAAAKKQDGDFELLKKIVFISAILQLVALAVYAMVLGASVGTYADHGTYFDPTLPDIPKVEPAAVIGSLFTGSCALAFWGGAIVVGGILPICLSFLLNKAKDAGKTMTYACASLVCTAVGGLVWRGLLYVVALTIFAIFLH
jgi:DMSO reductase anchor subunit